MGISHDVADRPIKLRRDAVYLKTEEGIFFRSAFGDFTLKGRTIYNSFSTLLPYLDGSVSERTLLGSVPPAQRPATEALLRLLIDREIVRRIDPADGALLDPDVADHFQAQIDYLGHLAEDPARRFLAFRNARILLVGEGESFLGAGLSLLSNGLAQLDIASADPADLADPAWDGACAQLAEHRLSATVNRHDPAAIEQSGFDLIVYCSHRPDLSAIERYARDRSQAFIPAFALDGHAYVGPACTPEVRGCWLCAMMRRSERIAPEAARNFWQALALGRRVAAASPPVSGVAAQMLGNSVALEVFKSLVDAAGPQTRSQLLDQDLATIETSVRRFLFHPECPRCAGIGGDAHDPEAAPALEPDAAVARWAPFMGHDFASYSGFDDAGIEQVPISVTSLPIPGSGRLYGWSIKDALHARAEALGEAIRRTVIAGDCAHLAEAAAPVDQTRASRISPARIAGWLGNGENPVSQDLSIRGTRIGDLAVFALPTEAIHPGLDPSGHFDPSHAGLGVGLSREDAIDRAVRNLFEHEIVAGLAGGTLPVWPWNAAGPLADGTTKYLLSIIASLGAPPPRLGITSHPAGMVAALSLPEDDRPVAAGALDLACHFSVPAAVNQLLERRVAQLQVERNHLPWEVRRRPGAFAEIAIELPDLAPLPESIPDVPADTETLAARLARDGSTLLVCDVTPPDVRATDSFVAVKVLLLNPTEAGLQ